MAFRAGVEMATVPCAAWPHSGPTTPPATAAYPLRPGSTSAPHSMHAASSGR